MTREQRARFEAHCVDQKARSKSPLRITCMVCEKLIWDLGLPCGQKEVAPGAVVIPYFGYFCGQACADAFERDYGIKFRRAATGEISYESQATEQTGCSEPCDCVSVELRRSVARGR